MLAASLGQSADLMLLVPFLLTDATDTRVCFQADGLGADGVEELIAASGLADHKLWLVLGDILTD